MTIKKVLQIASLTAAGIITGCAATNDLTQDPNLEDKLQHTPQITSETQKLPTAEEFLKQYPDAVVALGVVYYDNGKYDPSTRASGLGKDDKFARDTKYAQDGGYLIRAEEIFDSDIFSEKEKNSMLSKAGETIDLFIPKISSRYYRAFIKDELTEVSVAQFEKMVNTYFKDAIYDKKTIKRVKSRSPKIYVRLSATDEIRKDTFKDMGNRIKEKDPTPPLYNSL